MVWLNITKYYPIIFLIIGFCLCVYFLKKKFSKKYDDIKFVINDDSIEYIYSNNTKLVFTKDSISLYDSKGELVTQFSQDEKRK